MADVGTLIMKIKADTTNFQSGMAKTKSALVGIGKIAATAGVAIAAGLAVGAKQAVKLGAEAEEMLNKYNVVFDGMTDDVDDWAENFAKKVGRSKFDIQKAVSNLGDLQQGLGMTKDESFDLSAQIVELATDLASFNNVQDEQAIEAISKAMLGEAEAAKQLGLLLNVDRVKEYAESQGLVYEEVTDAQRAQLVYALAVKQSQNAIGDAERSAGSYTNQMKALKAGIKDAGTEIGMQLIPSLTKVVTALNQSAVPAIEVMFEQGKKLFNQLRQELQPTFDKLAEFWERNGPMIQQIAVDMFTGIVATGRMLWEFFETYLLPIILELSEFIIQNYPVVKSVFEQVFNSIMEVVKPVWELLEMTLFPILKILYNFIKDNFSQIGDFIVDAVNVALIPIKLLIEWVDNLITDLKAAWDWLKKVANSQDQTKSMVEERAGAYGASRYAQGLNAQDATLLTTGGTTNNNSNIQVQIYALDPNEAANQTVEALHLQGVGQ